MDVARDGRAIPGLLYLAFNQSEPQFAWGNMDLLRTDLGVCTEALSHVTMSSLFQQWPVSTGCKAALHEALGIIKISFWLPKQIARLNAFSFPFFFFGVVFVPLLSGTVVLQNCFPNLSQVRVIWSRERMITCSIWAWFHQMQNEVGVPVWGKVKSTVPKQKPIYSFSVTHHGGTLFWQVRGSPAHCAEGDILSSQHIPL